MLPAVHVITTKHSCPTRRIPLAYPVFRPFANQPPLADSAQGVGLNEILAFATERLADYKVPETIEVVDKIPRNTPGKVDRQLLLTEPGCLNMRHTDGAIAAANDR